MEKTMYIKGAEQKVSIHLSQDTGRDQTVSTKVRIYGDGNMDDKPGARPFKQRIFRGHEEVDTALAYFEERLSYYENKLGVKAQPDTMTKVVNNIKEIKNRFFKSDDNNSKNTP
jgi:hypothetical protein